MINVDMLLIACEAPYQALEDKSSVPDNIGDFQFVTYKFDQSTTHGAVAYHNPNDGALLIAHRGSATLNDWIKTNPSALSEIMGNPRETAADIAAKSFSKNIIFDLINNGKHITSVLQTGHSLGGRLAQQALIEIESSFDIPCRAVTFNSVPTKNPTNNLYKHINFQLSGGAFATSDIVSVLGAHLGENKTLICADIKNPIAAHSLKSFQLLKNNFPNFMQGNIDEVVFKTHTTVSPSTYQARNREEFTNKLIPNINPALDRHQTTKQNTSNQNEVQNLCKLIQTASKNDPHTMGIISQFAEYVDRQNKTYDQIFQAQISFSLLNNQIFNIAQKHNATTIVSNNLGEESPVISLSKLSSCDSLPKNENVLVQNVVNQTQIDEAEKLIIMSMEKLYISYKEQQKLKLHCLADSLNTMNKSNLCNIEEIKDIKIAVLSYCNSDDIRFEKLNLTSLSNCKIQYQKNTIDLALNNLSHAPEVNNKPDKNKQHDNTYNYP